MRNTVLCDVLENIARHLERTSYEILKVSCKEQEATVTIEEYLPTGKSVHYDLLVRCYTDGNCTIVNSDGLELYNFFHWARTYNERNYLRPSGDDVVLLS